MGRSESEYIFNASGQPQTVSLGSVEVDDDGTVVRIISTNSVNVPGGPEELEQVMIAARWRGQAEAPRLDPKKHWTRRLPVGVHFRLGGWRRALGQTARRHPGAQLVGLIVDNSMPTGSALARGRRRPASGLVGCRLAMHCRQLAARQMLTEPPQSTPTVHGGGPSVSLHGDTTANYDGGKSNWKAKSMKRQKAAPTAPMTIRACMQSARSP